MAAALQSLNSYSDLELALLVIQGYYGNGQDRKNRLGSRYAKVQGIVEQILRGTVPAGTGPAVIKTKVKAAVTKALQKSITELTEDIINEY